MRIWPSLAALALLSVPAQAFDCTKAGTAVEKAICADPALKALDDAMAKAYGEVRGLSTADERKMLAMSQKRWIAEREANCPQSAAGLAACLKETTQVRRDLLDGKPLTGPGAGGRIIPFFIMQDGSETQYEIDITLLRFANPQGPGEQRLNEITGSIADRMTLGPHREDSMGRIYALEEAFSITYMGPRLVSAEDTLWMDTGGAHGNGSVQFHNFDMATGRDYTIADFFSEDSAGKLMDDCKQQIIAEKKARLVDEPYDPATDPLLKDDSISEHVATLSRWSFNPREASVSFDAYAIGSYAEGSYECRFAMEDLKPLALSGAPLP